MLSTSQISGQYSGWVPLPRQCSGWVPLPRHVNKKCLSFNERDIRMWTPPPTAYASPPICLILAPLWPSNLEAEPDPNRYYPTRVAHLLWPLLLIRLPRRSGAVAVARHGSTRMGAVSPGRPLDPTAIARQHRVEQLRGVTSHRSRMEPNQGVRHRRDLRCNRERCRRNHLMRPCRGDFAPLGAPEWLMTTVCLGARTTVTSRSSSAGAITGGY
jgi:hypothetical protein